MGCNADFALEDELVAVLCATNPQRLLQSKNKRTERFSEFQIGATIPDLLIVTHRHAPNARKQSAKPFTMFESAVVADLLQRQSPRGTDVMRRLYARPSAFDRVVARLSRLGVVSKKSGGILTVQKDTFPDKVEIIAIEAKLRRLKEAVGQAKAYLTFSNAAFVALPETILAANRQIQRVCKDEGIGLIAVGRSKIRILVRPRRRRVVSAKRVWLLSRTVGLVSEARQSSHRSSNHGGLVASRKRSKAWLHAA